MTASSTSAKHRASLETNSALNQVNETLSQGTVELGAIGRQLNHEIVRRKAAEEALGFLRWIRIAPGSGSVRRESG